MNNYAITVLVLSILSFQELAPAQPPAEVFQDAVGTMEFEGQHVQEVPGGVQTKSREYTVVADGATRQVKLTGAYSGPLKAYFALRCFVFRGQKFIAAKLVGDPENASPLNAIGLRDGDIITRLDDLRVTSYEELDRHYDRTSVRFIRFKSDRISEDVIQINDFVLEKP